MEKVILISAKSGEGKTATALYLKKQFEEFNKKVAIIPFAKYIKMYMRDYLGWDGKTKDEWFRTLAQKKGTDDIRIKMKRPLFHCVRICEDIQVLQEDFDIFIIDDLRFRNEAYYTKAIFPDEAITIRVKRLGYISTLTTEQQNHPSEKDLDNFQFDYNIYCRDGENSLQHLYDELDRMFKGKWY